MVKYFRTLLKLLRFFLEDDFLFIGYRKDYFYYPAVKISRLLLKKHILEPFAVSRTIEINSEDALTFPNWIPMWYTISNPEKTLSERLWHLGFKVTNVVFNNGLISSFTYTYN